MKDAYYFQHDSNAMRDQKILAMRTVYGAEGYGWFWMLIELMRDEPTHKLRIGGKYALKSLARTLQCKEAKLSAFLSDCVNEFHLFQSDSEFIWSDSFKRRMELMDERREKAKASAESRWKKSSKSNNNPKTIDANAMQAQSEGDAIKESKEENRKEEERKPDTTGAMGSDESVKPETSVEPQGAAIIHPPPRDPRQPTQNELVQAWGRIRDDGIVTQHERSKLFYLMSLGGAAKLLEVIEQMGSDKWQGTVDQIEKRLMSYMNTGKLLTAREINEQRNGEKSKPDLSATGISTRGLYG